MAELILDATILVGLLLLKAAVLWVLIHLADRTHADCSKKRAVFYTILLGTLYLFFNTDSHYLGVLLVVSSIVLIASLLLSHSCQLSWIRAFCVSLVFVVLSVLVTDNSGDWLDKLLPERRTVASILIVKLDEITYGEQVHEENFVPSKTLGSALHVAVERTVVGNVVGMVAGQMKAGMDTYARAEMISSNASKRAAFIDELSTVGAAKGSEISDDSYDVVTPDEMTEKLNAKDNSPKGKGAPGTSDAEGVEGTPDTPTDKTEKRGGGTLLGALSEGLSKLGGGVTGKTENADAESGPDGTESGQESGGDVASVENADGSGETKKKKDVPEILVSKIAPVTTGPTAQATYAVVPGLGIGDAILTDIILTHLCSVGKDKSKFLALKGPANADPNLNLSTETISQTLKNMSSEEREKWMNARRSINVDATLKLKDRSVAVVNGKLVEPGDVVTIPGEGTNYTFRLMSVGPFEMYWAPLLGDGGSDQSKILRMSW